LKFFLNAGFIHDPESKIAKIDEKAYPSRQIAEPTTQSDIYRNVRTSVGQLTAQYVRNDGSSRIIECTCFIISMDGFALAAAHIVAGDGAKENQQSVLVRLDQ
jgi:hypothetical protein